MDDDVQKAFDDLRAEMKDMLRTRPGSSERRTAERDVRESREDLEDVLRREGYRISRRDLDAILEEREEARINALVDKRLAALNEEEEEEEEELDEQGNPKPKAKPKPKLRKVAGGKDEEEEWV